MSISNIEQLQDILLQSIEKLSKNKADIEEVSIMAKSCEAMLSSLKVQLQYNGMRNETPNIKFLQKCNRPETRLIEKPVQ